jgi:hypothetical protein
MPSCGNSNAWLSKSHLELRVSSFGHIASRTFTTNQPSPGVTRATRSRRPATKPAS